jgi:hypothetical protein
METIFIKREYTTPQLEYIKLDNEISLALESTPPEGPDETINNLQNPFRSEISLV